MFTCWLIAGSGDCTAMVVLPIMAKLMVLPPGARLLRAKRNELGSATLSVLLRTVKVEGSQRSSSASSSSRTVGRALSGARAGSGQLMMGVVGRNRLRNQLLTFRRRFIDAPSRQRRNCTP